MIGDAEAVTRLNAALQGRYGIERELGEGGMATVYLADDLKHERKVALKVLKPELAAVVGAARFLGEIKTTANLQHPHILPLFDSGEADKFLFYVMPYVEGETLREKLDREHQLPVDEAVRIATNVAEALDYAHRRGVIHRDIKPANILLQDGKPVLSDFGIALAVGVAGGGRLTETGLSLGTPHYMSPEQATGDLSVGAATDIYALGCVLYEMLVGDPPHVGSTAQAILGKIVMGDADPVTKHRKSVPHNVSATVARSLEKLPADRFVGAGDFAAGLASPDFRHGRQDIAAAAAPLWASGRTWMVALGTAAVGLVAGLMLPGGQPSTVAGSAVRFEVPVRDGLFMTVHQEPPLAFSPDGTRLAYLTAEGIAIRPIDSFEVQVLASTANATTPMFSPDGTKIAFLQQPYLRWVPVDGSGGPVTVAEVGAAGGVGSSWSENGGFLLTGIGANGIVWVSEDDGVATQITEVLAEEGENIHAWPRDLPGTDAILYTALGPGGGWEGGNTVLVDRQTGRRDVLLEGGTNAQYSPTGHILYVDESGTIFARPFDLASRSWTGSAEPVVSGVRIGTWGGGASYHVSNTGALAWLTGSEFETYRMVALDRSGDLLEDFGPTPTASLKLSGAGDRLALGVPTGNNIDIWVLDIASGEMDPFTLDINEEETAIWSPDGQRIMWAAAQPGGSRNAYVQPADRSADRELVFEHPHHLHLSDWSEDGRYVTFYDFHPTQGQNVYLVDLQDPERIPVPVAATEANERAGTFSPDGRWLTYSSERTGQSEVYSVSVPDGRQERQLSTGGGYQPRWDRQQRELFYLTSAWTSNEPPTLVARSVRSGEVLRLAPEDSLFTLPTAVDYEPSPDGQRFYTFLDRPETRAYSIRVLLNWTAELEAPR